MNKHHSAALIALPIFAIASTSTAQNIVLNPGFETGPGADATDWAELSGPSGFVGRSTDMPNTGTASAYMSLDHITNPPAGAAYFIEQIQPVGSIDPLSNYNLSFQAKVDSTDFVGVDMFVQILWLDQDASDGGGVKGEMLTSLIGLGINTSYQEFAFNDMDVPDTADSFILRFQLSAGAVDNIANGLYVDDASLTAANACFADCDANGTLNVDDIDCFVTGFLGTDLDTGDCDGNGVLNVDDVDCFVDAFLAGCP